MQAEPDSARLLKADAAMIDTLRAWFDSEEAVTNWGGPDFRFPFSRESFRQDCRWPELNSYALLDESNTIVGFGQFYPSNNYVRIARIGVNPDSRQRGYGRLLMLMLMTEGRRVLGLSDCCLFVMKDNVAASALYHSLGFEIADFPVDARLANVCEFMILKGHAE